MKTLNQYIQESILDDDEDIDNKLLKVQPKDKEELIDIIVDSLKQGNTDLNFIDTSKIRSMENLFYLVNNKVTVKDIDISNWDVSNVNTMSQMFFNCTEFKSDLSKWNVSNVKNMAYMFYNCQAFDFNTLNDWDISNVVTTEQMFSKSGIKTVDFSRWNPIKLRNALGMFSYTDFNSDISNWKLIHLTNISHMFFKCPKFDCNLNNWKVKDEIFIYQTFDKSYLDKYKIKWYFENLNEETN